MNEQNKALLIEDLERLLQQVRQGQVVRLSTDIGLHHTRVGNEVMRLPGGTYKIEFVLMPEADQATLKRQS